MRAVAVLGCVGLLAILGNGQTASPNCKFRQYLELGQTYYVFPPPYPNYDTETRNCEWQVESGYRARLDCSEMDMPNSKGCNDENISVQVNNNEVKRFCGKQTFSVVSDGRSMNISYNNRRTSRSKFLCRLYAVRNVGFNENCECGWTNPTRIVNGVNSGVNEYPMMAGLVDIRSARVFCGSTIITSKYLITAAHCLNDRNTSSMAVLTGEHDTSTGSDTNATRLHRVRGFKVHPDYRYGRNNNYADIGIVIVEGNIEFNMLVGPACLPFRHRRDSFAGSLAQILGWGLVEFSGQQASVLQKAQVSILVEEKCRRQYPQLPPGQVCTDGGNSDACQRDSGGPVLWRNPSTNKLTLIGIISYGDYCGDGSYGVNMRVGEFLDWILLETSDAAYCGTE